MGNLGIVYTTWPQHNAGERLTVTVKNEAVPNGEIVLTQGAHIHARDGQVGRLDGFLATSTTGQITHLLREGHLGENQVYLKLDKAEIGVLPTTPVRT